jgi:hypothetical protein
VTASPASLINEKSGAGSPSLTGKTASKPRAVGIVRVSHVGGRSGERFVSPDDQARRIKMTSNPPLTRRRVSEVIG